MEINIKDFEVLLKIILIGESGVGKTSLLTRYIEKKFDENLKATIGIDCKSKIIKKNDKKVKVNFCDTAGQERFNSIVSTTYKGSDGILLVYDISNKNTFVKIENWLNQIKLNCDENVKIFLIGNKLDLNETNRNVAFEEAKLYAKDNGLYFFECSALNNLNDSVDECFNKLIDQILIDKLKEEDEIENMDFIRTKQKTLVLNKPPTLDEKKCC